MGRGKGAWSGVDGEGGEWVGVLRDDDHASVLAPVCRTKHSGNCLGSVDELECDTPLPNKIIQDWREGKVR